MAGQAAQTNTATPPAANGGIDVQALTQGIVQGVSAALGEALKPLGEQLGKLAAPEKKPEAATDKPITAQDVAKMVTDALAGQKASADGVAKREQFITANLGKLPAAYRNQLGTDPAKWADESKAIQGQFEADVKGLPGVKLESLGTPAGDGGKTPAGEKPDLSKIPAFERLHMGLEKQLPVPAANTTAAGGEAK